jgi:hypothetical protein
MKPKMISGWASRGRATQGIGHRGQVIRGLDRRGRSDYHSIVRARLLAPFNCDLASSRQRQRSMALFPSSAAAMPNEQEKRPAFNGHPLKTLVLRSIYSIPFSFIYFRAPMRDPERSYADSTTYSSANGLFKALSGIYVSEDQRIAAIDKHLVLLGSTFEVVEARDVKSDGKSCGPYSVYVCGNTRGQKQLKHACQIPTTRPVLLIANTGQTALVGWTNASVILAIADSWLCALGGVYLQRAVIQPLTDCAWAWWRRFQC